ncbi:hypothetical protein [Lysobacter enzymogenes]|uniref:hypothetical protein n=1 Tax=Lysobacter enzymogenes TaxID=69 RepID=UPI001A972711|nr:hypothetical protein [Lysobacter enzymogenes]QQP94894.1 hypothetical protein JHW38_16780 [Lysobacter enzymogenes]
MAAQDSIYARQWRDRRARRLWFYGVWIGGFAVLALLMFGVLPHFPQIPAGAIFVVLGLTWLAGSFFAGMRLQRFPCPRCGRSYFMTSLIYFPFARQCRHCGLPRDE